MRRGYVHPQTPINEEPVVCTVWPAPDLQVDFYDLVSISLQ